ncbi:MAG TPA: serine/threonine-protein kinase, partial [Planctomycetota bacterium]|nr:serine/threonine-protein kinase [Planctomycetota bacterium]
VAERFRIIRFVGQGGMGKVFLAQDETLGRPIALKCVPQEIIFDGDARDDLRQEASRLLDLTHENIVRIHTYYDGPTWPFFAMEYLQGPTLKQLLRERRRANRVFSTAEVLLIARQVGRGLAHAHAKGIIHRDLKPGNLMLAAPVGEELIDRDVVKITDFGISRVVADTTLRHAGKRSGTLPYMSPEQYQGEPCTVRSDIYSFACSLYELAEGHPPFHAGDIGYQILNKEPAGLRGAPAQLSPALLRALSKRPEDRFASVEAFVDALNGSTAPQYFRLRRAALVAVVLVVGAVAAAISVPGWNSPKSRSPSRNSTNDAILAAKAKAQVPTEAAAAEIEEFRSRVRDELAKQIPWQIGRAFSPTVAVGTDSISLRIKIPEPRTSSRQRSLLERLVFIYTGESAADKWALIRGTLAEGSKEFELKGLTEGLYSLRSYLEGPAGSSSSGSEPLLEEPCKFRVDLTPPSFEIVPVLPAAFVDSNPPVRQTFDEAVDLKIVSTYESGEIAEAKVALVSGEVALPWAPIPKLPFWHIELPPGVTTTYRVYAKDAVGNQSAAMEVSLRRLKLEVISFGLAMPDGVWGNLATVKGFLRVEGDQSPSLRFFIQGVPVEPVSSGTRAQNEEERLSGRGGDSSAIPFSAVLKLPTVTNAIELRYAWRDNPPQAFAIPQRISDIKVRAPRLVLEEAQRRTAESRWRLLGSVEPYFDGLEVSLERKGQGNQRLVLTTGFLSSTATFASEVQLIEGENTFVLSSFYNGDQIPASSRAFSIYCDKVPPSFDGPARFDPVGDFLQVSFRSSEELAELRVEEWTPSGETGPWRTLERDPNTLSYSVTLPIPARPVTLRVEMTDLAGNIGRGEQLCPVTRADARAGFLTGAAFRDAGSTSFASPSNVSHSAPESAAASTASGVTVISSPFVREMEVEFVPFGQDRLEMSRTEVPEKAWFRFLDERGHGFHGTGEALVPMVLDERSVETLREFVAWFEEKANDGYRYEIPTAAQWLQAFAGERDAERARRSVTAWFQAKLDSVDRFDPRPKCSYETDAVKEVGRRPENRAPGGLLDMEANVQEVVLDGGLLKVIGGHAGDKTPDALLSRALAPRPFGPSEAATEGRFTGLRLLRRPRLAE